MRKILMLMVAVWAMIFDAKAVEVEKNDVVTLDLGGDVVSSYIWRGTSCGKFSVQPSLSLTFNKPGITIGAWASIEVAKSEGQSNFTELDLSIAWNPIDALTIGLTDYFIPSYEEGENGMFFRGWKWNQDASHNLELNLAYDFGPVALAWNTCLSGPDRVSWSDKRNYSTYAEISAPWKIGEIEGSAAVGAHLWDDYFTVEGESKGFNVCNISLRAEKKIWKLPLFGQIIVNPEAGKTYFVVGLSF